MPTFAPPTTDNSSTPARKPNPTNRRSMMHNDSLRQEAETSHNMHREGEDNLQTSADTIYGLQQTVGNRAVQSLLNDASGDVYRVVKREDMLKNQQGGGASVQRKTSDAGSSGPSQTSPAEALISNSDTHHTREVIENSDMFEGVTAPDAGPETTLLHPERPSRQAEKISDETLKHAPNNKRTASVLKITLNNDFQTLNNIQDNLAMGLKQKAGQDLLELHKQVEEKYEADMIEELFEGEPGVAKEMLILQAQIEKLLDKLALKRESARRPTKSVPTKEKPDDQNK